jgi:hypothetical protein
MPRTFRSLINEARTLLQDKLPGVTDPTTGTGGTRVSDAEMFEAINGAMVELRSKRPDLFLPLGLRNPLPFYTAAANLDTAFPIDTSVYNAMVYYVVGRAELRDDPYSDDSRAVTLMNKFVSQILQVAS